MTVTPHPKPTFKGTFMVVDDEELILKVWDRALSRSGHQITTFSNGHDALAEIERNPPDVAILDNMMPEMTGLELLQHIKSRAPEVEVIMMTGYASIDTALEAMKGGAYDYLQKPFEQIEIAVRVAEKALERKRLQDVNQELERRLETIHHVEGIIGTSPKMQNVFRLIDQVAQYDATVMISGETGTGKERIAQSIHMKSPRRTMPFVPIVCSAFPENLIESTLFGYRKGAFTGASSDKIGMIQAADGGTLFLDEVGDIPLPIQVKLLRVLQEGEFLRVGDVKPTPVDLRVLTATHVDLKEAVAQGRFREDLYYRLNVIEIELPPLRERREDIPVLAHHFLKMYSERYNKPVHKIDNQVLLKLQHHEWPGNVRQLEHMITRALILEGSDTLTTASLGAEFQDQLPAITGPAEPSYQHLPFREAKRLAVERFEKRYLTSTLEAADGNVSQAAREADMDRANFRRLLKRYELA